MKELSVVRLGEVGYEEGLKVQRQLHEKRVAGEVPDTLLLLSHPHVLTTGSCGGRSDRWSNLNVSRDDLKSRGVVLWESDRGGDITWHGPGQLVGYLIVDLQDYAKDVGRFVRMIEEIQLRCLESMGITAERQRGFTGVWIGHEKICAIGVRVRSWVTMHGFALNMKGDLEGFGWIVPCGLEGRGVTSIARKLKGASLSEAAVVDLVEDAAAAVFDRVPVRRGLGELL